MEIVYSDTQISEFAVNVVDEIAASGRKFLAIGAVPMGGYPFALELAELLHLPVFTTRTPAEALALPYRKDEILIVDDIVDSGATIAPFKSRGFAVAAAVERIPPSQARPDFSGVGLMEGEWATFPWEKGIAGPEDNVRRILQYLGESPSREGLRDTPKRVVRSWERLFGGYKQNPQEILRTQFGETSGYDEMVVLKKIRFFSTCEHHMLPFYGHATVAYIPRDRVVGISKLARLVEVFSRRLQIQERLTEEIAGAIQEALDPVGVGVTMTAKHFCMISRGVEKESAEMTTSKLIGAFQTPEVRAEFFNLSL